MAHRTVHNPTNESIDSPTTWFAVLERALRTGDFDLAARAKRELERLGVTVTFDRPLDRAVPA